MHLRVDLDGVPLSDENGRPTATFRYRTKEGLVLKLPDESDVLVPWEVFATADIELRSGCVRLEFTPSGTRTLRWLGGSQVLVGEWTDRLDRPRAPSSVR